MCANILHNWLRGAAVQLWPTLPQCWGF